MSTEPAPIYSVSNICDLMLFRTDPPMLLLCAEGYAATSGWRNPQLIARHYVSPPADGILDFDFVALPPDGIVLPALTRIRAETLFSPVPEWARAVRVHSANDTVSQRFPFFGPPIAQEVAQESAAAEYSLSAPHEGAEVVPLLITEAEGYHGPGLEGTSCREFLLASVSIPETKTVLETRCIAKDPFNGKCIAKADVPIIYRRTSKVRLLARVCVPDDKDVTDNIEECVKQAVVAGVAVTLVTYGNLAAGAAALKSYLIACLKSKLGDFAGDIDVDLRREKVSPPWKKL